MTAPLSSSASLPVVRLLPKANARAIRHGFPWVYANEMVLDRRTKKLAPGTLARLEDDARQPMGLVSINPTSKIIARMLDQNPEAVIDQAWFEAHLSRALALRSQLFDAPYYRLIHAEADGLPGVIIDRFGDTCVVQPNAAWADALLDPLCAALTAVTGIPNILKNAGGRTRTLEGLDDVSAVLRGAAPDAALPVPMNGATYMADLTGGQKTGLFYDQRPNHAFAANLSKDARVLDVFSHVGGFSLAALANGATSALAVDGSAPALELAEAGAKAMGMQDKFSIRQGDAFDTLAALRGEAAQFDVVICDPPAFAPSRNALEAGLRAYEKIARLAAPLVAENGILALCSCSHAADLAQFRNASVRGIGRAGRRAIMLHTGFAGPDHPQLPQLAESGYLKSLFFRL
ncbi:class I SAM-dependent rRNA methyltransferase [Sulfitobacter mediterraneus]|uniref:RSP_2647 family RNA methyltransferase n=1 Tax=Sulfitobacter mediterraneus TaxID=83219 RepID=UPI00193A6E53|nr:class I SAM-dependent rRNA methyltransferase [Sulfitobacter mediterraneus]MBM1556767.1 class I SAM-dependent rRNA methyltransferase [Sulfitobacter mediterraneus]MBM1568951.1 class I SAM-dependent rRNA methyltransferase [Sulfitobacter mediterraneus]MBM1572379.1 class I SAM-dependent rRNA methyltransferase [Sulfitobacter mediterraneus]MBM1576542.1 class I SAM-dependent rRNA methyltransferase [Sulfitobacter mediterraneus]MBM1579725.1 class I SAM-dependent rRNA methyltransferase [Sulfitobacter 